MKTKKDPRHEITARLDDEELRRFRNCVAVKQLKSAQRITHQDIFVEALVQWMEAVENQHGTLITRAPILAKGKHG